MLNRRNSFLNNKGFSLIELMVVVAIIGILAAIGIPQYAKFQAKTRQSEAKGSLASAYASETSFFGEWSMYSMDMKNIGFGVSGKKLRYVTGFPAAAGTGCTAYSVAGGAPGEWGLANASQPAYLILLAAAPLANIIPRSWSCGVQVNTVSATQATAWSLPTGITMNANNQCTNQIALPVNTTTVCNNTVNALAVPPVFQVFRLAAMGDPNANVGAAASDGWTIDQAKSMSNTTPGIL